MCESNKYNFYTSRQYINRRNRCNFNSASNSKMKKKQSKKLLWVLTIVFLIIVCVTVIFVKIFTKNDNNKNLVDNNDNFSKNTRSSVTRINISEKLNENKKIDDLDITNIELKSDGQVTQLTAIINNNTGKTKGDYPAKVIFIDSNNNEIAEMGIYIKKLQPGESTILNGKITFDYTNAYNFNIQK